MELHEEIEALQSIYSHKDELSVSEDKDGNHVLCFYLPSRNKLNENVGSSSIERISLSIVLSSTYPSDAPSVSISSSCLRKEQQNKMMEELRRFIKNLPSEPMMMEIVCWVQEHLHEYVDQYPVKDQCGGMTKEIDQSSYAVLHIDHMRSKQKYLKTLISWANARNLQGRVIFCFHLIFVLLIGSGSDIKGFILNLRTQTVDVDSTGRGCKEKMMSVVSEGTVRDVVGKGSFESLECSTVTEVETVFRGFGLENIFRTSVHCYFPKKAMISQKGDTDRGLNPVATIQQYDTT